MTTTATIQNMREYYAEGVFAYSPDTGEEYSANPADYWDARDGFTMKDANAEPMILVHRRVLYQDVAIDGAAAIDGDGAWREQLSVALAEADAALGGDFNDAEHEALYSVRETIAQLLGVTSEPPSPSYVGEEGGE